MKTHRPLLTVIAVAVRAIGILGPALLLGHAARAQTILGTTGGYAVMSGGTVTNNGVTTLNGNLGVNGTAGSGSYTFTTGSQFTTTVQNQTDFTKAFNGLAAMPGAVDLSGKILGTTAGATTLTPGIYKFTSTAQLTGTLILDAQHQSNAVWVFQIGSTLTTAASSAVTFTNLAANAVVNDGLFWQVGTTTTFGTNTAFEGNVLGGTTFSFASGATINDGRALSGTGAITLAGNNINFIGANSGYSGGLAFDGGGNVVSAIPEPATNALIAACAALGLALYRRRRAAS